MTIRGYFKGPTAKMLRTRQTSELPVPRSALHGRPLEIKMRDYEIAAMRTATHICATK